MSLFSILQNNSRSKQAPFAKWDIWYGFYAYQPGLKERILKCSLILLRIISSISNAQIVEQVLVYNVLGKLVKSFNNNNDRFYIGVLSKGIYLVRMIDEDFEITRTLKL